MIEFQVQNQGLRQGRQTAPITSHTSVITIGHDQPIDNTERGSYTDKVEIECDETDKKNDQKQLLSNAGQHLFKQYKQMMALLNKTLTENDPTYSEKCKIQGQQQSFKGSETVEQGLWEISTIYSQISQGCGIANKINELLEKNKRNNQQLIEKNNYLEVKNTELENRKKELEQDLQRKLRQKNEQILELKRAQQLQETPKPKSLLAGKGFKRLQQYKKHKAKISVGLLLVAGVICLVKCQVIDFKKIINKFS